MLFNSHEFIFLFLPLTLLGFFVIGRGRSHEPAIAWLVAMSLLFYGWWKPAYLLLILASIGVNYAVGVQLSRRPARWLLAAGVTFNLGLIAYYKYAHFLVENINRVAGTHWTLGSIVLPLAISFFTFQQIAYLVDSYRGETREYNFLHYCLFVTFFPQLIAGPIVHHREMMPQFAGGRTYRLSSGHLAAGITIFAIGLFKKVGLADEVAEYATPVFDAAKAGREVGFLAAWGGSLAYTFQLYFDFSGYSDMAIGIARMFGIYLPLNFHSPYKASSIIDFWRRWHMTLSRFLRDYVYIPLGGNRRGRVRRHVNIMITMFLGGLWHGAGWTFVAWGTLHGIYLVVNHAWHRVRPPQAVTTGAHPALARWAGRLLTFLAVVVAWVFFRAEGFDAALIILHGMASPLTPVAGAEDLLGGWRQAALLLLLLAIAWFAPNTQEFMSRHHRYAALYPEPKRAIRVLGRGMQWRPSAPWAIAFSALLVLTIVHLSKVSEFLYFNF